MEEADRHLLRVAVQAPPVKKKDRKDVALTFVIDVSGSMGMENRLGLVKRSLGFLLNQLRPADRVGIVVYGSTGRKLLDPTPVARKAEIVRAIEALETEGSTNLEQGLDIGYENRHVANADFRNDKVDAGEVGAGHHVTALYEFTLKPGARGRLATVRLRYREPATRQGVEVHESLGAAQVAGDVAQASPSYRLAAAAGHFAELLRGSAHAKGTTYRQVLDRAERAAADLRRPADAAELADLVRRASEISKDAP